MDLGVHLDLLVQLHRLLGAFGVMTGLSLVILAAGTAAALTDADVGPAGGRAGVVILASCGAVLLAGGAALILTGRALRARRTGGRLAALLLAIPNLINVPFGTALSIYGCWVLLNDDARRVFGRPPRGPGRAAPASGAPS